MKYKNRRRKKNTNFDEATRSSRGVLDSSSNSITDSAEKQALIVLSKDLTRSSSDKDLNECSPK
jgi:hypothetical protein